MSDPYDALAPHYRDYSGRKTNYLNAVDDFILRHVDHPPLAPMRFGNASRSNCLIALPEFRLFRTWQANWRRMAGYFLMRRTVTIARLANNFV
jgi:hypothetical protein